jgi:N-acetylmuramoyl-L-alanine amidase
MTALKILAFVFLAAGISFHIQAQSQPTSTTDESHINVVVIDPGHGGRDPGAMAGNAREKNIVLDIALKLGNYISNAFPEVDIIYTRKTDVFVPLYKRAEIANKNNADLFISIHVNSVSQSYVQGTETFILGMHRTQDNLEVAKKENEVILLEDDYTTTYEGFNPNSPESYIMFELVQDEYLEQSAMLASAIQDQFRERAKLIDRSVKQAGFLVLRQTTMPSVLVEAGFLSHRDERSYLMSDAGRDYLASSIFLAFKDYKTKVEEKSSFHIVSEEPVTKSEIGNKNETPQPIQKKIINPDEQKGIWFSVQIAALSAQKKVSPENFKGENSVFEQSNRKIYRYFCGKFENLENARKEKNRLQAKFNGAFVVAFDNGKLISVKKALRKM